MYSTVIFDLDGTLTDPGEGITNSVAFALERFGISITDKTELYKFIGPPLKDSFMTYYNFSESDALLAVDYYREYFSDRGIFENKVYCGIEKLLFDIKNSNRKIALATSKPEGFAKQILEHFNLNDYFDFIAGATLDGRRSKKGDVIIYALESLAIKNKSEVVMVGDRKYDVIGAKEAGIDCIGVLFGYGNRKELTDSGAAYIAETVEDIFKFL